MLAAEPSEVIAFYSYTGGAGRSMALANVACLLARRCPADRGVLMVDCDLESPSLHRFFHDKFRNWSGTESNGTQLDAQPGLLDLFVELDARVPGSGPVLQLTDEVLAQVDLGRFVIPTDIPSLSLLKAGRFDDSYFPAVSRFEWAGLHERAPWIIPSLLDFWARRYRFILIDSTCGVNGIADLCAMMLPDKLVTVFTSSRHSLLGVLDFARCAADHRKTLDSASPLAIFPLPSKVETSEPELRNDWRFGGAGGNPEGYQPQFEALFCDLEPGCEPSLDEYFSDVQIPYVPRYAYGDPIAATHSVNSTDCPVVLACRNLATRLHRTRQPWCPIDDSVDLSVIEMEGRFLPLSEAQELCLRHIEGYSRDLNPAKTGEAIQTLAQIKERLGKPEEAAAHFLEAVAFYRARDDGAGVAHAVTGLARLHRLMGHSDQARVYYLDAAKLYRTGTEQKALAPTLAILGDLDCEAGETEAAGEHYREAIERYQNDWDDAGVARTLVRLGDLEKRSGKLDVAEEHYLHASKLFHKQRENSSLAGALTSVAEVQARAGKLELAEENFSRAASIYRAERNGLRLAYILRCLADVDKALKKIGQALAYYLEAIDLFRKGGEDLDLAAALQSLGDLKARAGGHADAQLHYNEAALLYRKDANNLGVANTLRSLGDLERGLGRFDAARSNYEEALGLYRTEKNNLGLANSLQSLGDLEKRTGRIQEAEKLYTQAIQIYRNEGASLGLANSLKSLGDVETEAGNLGVAQDHYEQAIELYRTGGRSLGLANALQRLGDLKRLQKRFKEATEHYSTARDLYRGEQHMSGLAYTCSELARVAHALFDFTGSIEYLSEAAAAAKISTAPNVISYVWDVRREILGESATVGT